MVLYDDEDFEDYDNALNSIVVPPPLPPSATLDFKENKIFTLSSEFSGQPAVCKREIVLDSAEEEMFDEYEKVYEELRNKFEESKQQLFDSIKQEYGETFDDDDE
ncbi:hypothetical protein NAEGRDRAFT_79486 [Naegleria gruberi]|uniref:Uncharacterized protein n=1 Tax=Naegleria gruberi TaxID=5762 RepID=D2VDA2_NAEGR|nr:uncharacterized protein NAEGRDRAFT_79486 [Naegleria gruberi]EFC45198.1 hypothetical protein NAEGRDRAFT_79486 [Naegleria gruberi]|eukprot:XP_002677942.1 hypothetical protein NAEGRDRAFT_79486 [Naegleria gruberi strain NEG-M]